MKASLERTRLIITEYTEEELRKVEALVSTIDKSFYYEDQDKGRICMMPGMLDDFKKEFPKVHIDDQSKTYWDYAKINKVKLNDAL